MPEDSLPRQPKTGTGGRRSAEKLTSSSTKNRYRRTPFRRKVDILVNPPLTIYFCYQKVSGNKNAWVAEFRFGKRKWIAELRFGKRKWVAETFLKDCKGLRHYWQIGICQPIIQLLPL